MNRAIGYVRVSTELQAADGVSLDAQRRKLALHAELHGLKLLATEADVASAKSLRRPGLQRALAALEVGRADTLIVAKLDRLTRSVRDLGTLVMGPFAAGRAALVSVADSIDTASAAGRLVLHVLVSVSQWEREAIGERTADALAELRAQGIQLGGEALGWRRTEQTDPAGRRIVEAVDHELATVERIRQLRGAGLTLRAVAAELAREGHRTKRGGRWHASTVRAVLARA